MAWGRIRAGGIGVAAVLLLGGCGGGEEEVALGEGDPDAGRELYALHCATCHGEEGFGTATGPPVVTELYVPGSLSDQQLATAITEGVPEDEWEFGPMPATPGLSSREVADLVAYVRALQREAGLIE